MLHIERPRRALLIIAPTLTDCRDVMSEFNLDPGAVRCVTHPDQLRVLARPGTVFVAGLRDHWSEDRAATRLGEVVDTLQHAGRLREAKKDDLAEARL